MFLIIPSFKWMKMIMIIIQLIFSFALVSKILYKNHSLYSAPNVQYIQRTDFYPIKSLYKVENGDGVFKNINYILMDNNEFSLVQNEKYSTQCLEHYFIKKGENCPITDIIFDNRSSNIYNNVIQKSNEEYFYYTNQNKLGKLYKSFNYSEFEENKEDNFSNDDINKIFRKETNKISNPIIDFKYFIKFFDVICIFLIITSLFFSLFEYADDLKFGVVRIFNIFFQLIILIIYIIRYSKFINVKQFLIDNEDIYKNDAYYPNKRINFDSVPLVISINIFIINTLYIIFPNRTLTLKIPKDCLTFNEELIIIFYIVFFLLSKFSFEIFDFVNDSKIFTIYDDIIYNWKFSPIIHISLTNYREEKYHEYMQWNEYSLKIERLTDYNYINIYSSNNSKLCGKDNLGNNLYFPEDIDCPINDIFISKNDESIPGYSKLVLDYNYYLYYTNKATEGKLLIDLRKSNYSEVPLQPRGDYNINYQSIPFYEEFDLNENNEKLYSFYYLGVNSSSVSKYKINNLENKFNVYSSIFIFKIVFIFLF